eukprot:Nk52_evm6s539 gene=Nk52_evmTU6s539
MRFCFLAPAVCAVLLIVVQCCFFPYQTVDAATATISMSRSGRYGRLEDRFMVVNHTTGNNDEDGKLAAARREEHIAAQMCLLEKAYGNPKDVYSEQSHTAVRRADAVSGEEGKVNGGALVSYWIEMAIGNPQQLVNISLDTGSSNLGVLGADISPSLKYYDWQQSTTSVNTGRGVTVNYGGGSWIGILTEDEVSIPSIPDIKPTKMTFGRVTVQTDNFFKTYSGIWGLAYQSLSQPEYETPKVPLTVFSEANNFKQIFGMLLCPTGQAPATSSSSLEAISPGGYFTMDGYNPSLMSSEPVYTAVSEKKFFGIVAHGISVGNTSICSSQNLKTIVDSGTTALVVGSETLIQIQQEIRDQVKAKSGVDLGDSFVQQTGNSLMDVSGFGAAYQDPTTFLSIFPTLSIQVPIEGESKFMTLEIAPQYYLEYSGGTSYYILLQGSNQLSVNMILGGPIVNAYYVTYDMANDRVGFSPPAGNCSSSFSSTYQPLGTPNGIKITDSATQMPMCSDAAGMILGSMGFIMTKMLFAILLTFAFC